MATQVQDDTARRIASEARDIAIENRAWRIEHDRLCTELRGEFKAMVKEIEDGIAVLRDALQAAIAASRDARAQAADEQSQMWIRVAWAVIGALTSALGALTLAVLTGRIG